MSWTSFFLYLSFCSAVSVGCKEPSSIDGYCLSCLEGYDSSDNTCNTCKVLDPYTEPSDTNPIYLQSINGSCYDATKYYSKEITYYSINYTNTITIQPTDIKLYKSPCYSMTTNTQPYYFGFWLELKNQKGTFEPLSVSISWNVNGFQMAVECGGECDSYGETYKNETTFYTYSGKNDTCYIFVSTYYEVTEMASVTVLLSSDNEEIFEEFDVDFIKELNSSGLTHNFYLPFKESGFYTTPVCVPSRMLKAINIDIEVPKGLNVYIKGNEAKYRYVQQYYFSNGKRVCDLLKTSQIEGEIYSVGKDQYVSTLLTYDDTYFDSFTKTKRISSIDEPTQWRHLTILTIDDSANDSFSISIICPEGCNQDNQQGSCSIQTGKCCCKYGYFGKACRLPCYNPINNSFNEIYGDQDQLCYMGTKNCDDDCVCNSGYKVDGHMCISLACLNEESSVDCFSGSVHCEKNCSCSYGYVPLSTTSPQSGCKLETCGNNKVDDNEECDGGVGCHINCSCYSGYEPSTIQQGSCQEVPFAAWKIITLVFVGLFLIVLSLIIPLLALFIVLKRKVVDKNVFVQQQPTYYYDITQSQVIFKESKCSITPIKLDFGNGNNPTKIFDTRFEELELKNKSRKWMMVIFHTPNSPKYIFHFKPQVLFIKPRSARVATVYMTLNCTTRILGTRLHFSVYHSEKNGYIKKDRIHS
ncbi:Serine-threonine protein kinase [Entamoeba marina]